MSVRRIVSADEGAAAEACSQHLLAVLGDAVRAKGLATLAVSGGSSPKLVFARMAALGRLGTPEDIAAVVAMLAGPDAGWVTGQNLRANGGLI